MGFKDDDGKVYNLIDHLNMQLDEGKALGIVGESGCGKSIDHVGFGVDCLYGDHVGVHHAFAAALSTAETANTSYEEVPFVWGLENPTEASWNIIRWLVKHNYSEEDIGKVIGGNAIRVLREVWA